MNGREIVMVAAFVLGVILLVVAFTLPVGRDKDSSSDEGEQP